MQSSRIKFFLLWADLLAVLISFRIAYLVRYELNLLPEELDIPPFAFYYFAILVALGSWALLFLMLELDRIPVGHDPSLSISHFATAYIFQIALLLAGSYLAKVYYSRLLLIFLSLLLLFFLLATRAVYLASLKWLREYGIGLRRVAIVGQSDLAREIAERIRLRPELHYEFAGFLFPASGRSHDEPGRVTFGTSEELARELAKRRINELIFAMPIRRDTEMLELIAHCQKLDIAVRLVPEYYELHTSQVESFNIDGIPLFELRETSLQPGYQLLKRVMDFFLALILLTLFSPVIFVIGITLCLATRARVLRREVRVGLAGQPFVMYRFNVSLAETSARPENRTWKVRFCRFLDRYSLSEVPQLWNVLKGEMSIVGPRPETPERVRLYSAWHKRRLQLKPGITGLAQVKGLRGLDPSDLKTKYDLEYAANFTPFLDLALILATTSTLFRRRKAVGSERLAVP